MNPHHTLLMNRASRFLVTGATVARRRTGMPLIGKEPPPTVRNKDFDLERTVAALHRNREPGRRITW
jgi:hypothetical protein